MESRSLTFRNIAEMHFEVSKNCNLSCVYCFAYQKAFSSNSFMPLKVACKYIDLIFRNTCSEDIDIVFHGGEPFLQSVTWFHNVIEYATRLSKVYHKNLRFLMQSNCTLLDDKKSHLIKEHHIIVGTSLDGPPYINDLSREKGHLVLKNIQRLKEIECFGGVICVINKYNYDRMKEIMNFFEQEDILTSSVVIGYSVGRGENLVSLNPDEIFTAYKGIYDYFEETGGEGVIEGSVAAKINRYISPPRPEEFEEIVICSHPFCGGGITTIMCDTSGNLYPCGCSICNPHSLLGNLNLISDQVFISRVKGFHEKSAKYVQECTQCDAAQICSFGCPTFNSIDPQTTESECHTNKLFYAFLRERKVSIIKRIANNMNRRRYGAKTIHQYNDNKCLP